MESTTMEQGSASCLGWPFGEFYVPGFSSDGRTALVPGAADSHRRFFLKRAATLEPDLLPSLREVADDSGSSLSLWAERWNLKDRWCLLLAQDTLCWWRLHPEAEGWEFEQFVTVAGWFPFRISPLQLEPFFFDPTWRRRQDFQRQVIEQVRKALKDYCDRVEADALAAGLKRAPRKRETQHFDWLVRYQIRGESFASIARTSSHKFSGGRQTVRKAIIELADYIALTPRPPT